MPAVHARCAARELRRQILFNWLALLALAALGLVH